MYQLKPHRFVKSIRTSANLRDFDFLPLKFSQWILVLNIDIFVRWTNVHKLPKICKRNIVTDFWQINKTMLVLFYISAAYVLPFFT